MSVRLRKWKNEEGKMEEAWVVDVKMKVPGRGLVRLRKTSPFNNRRAAEQYEYRLRSSMLDGSYWKDEKKDEELENPTFSAFLPRYLTHCENNNKVSTFETKKVQIKTHLEPFFGSMRLEDIGAAAIETFKAAMRKKLSRANLRKASPTRQAIKRRYGKPPKTLSPKTVNNTLTILSNLLNVAEEQGVIDQARRIRRFKTTPPPYDFLTFDEAERLVAATEPKWRAAILLGTKAGLRLGEIRALQWSDVDLVRARIVVRRNFWKGHLNETPKGGRSRTVDIPESLVSELKAAWHLKGPWVFCDGEGEPLTQKQLERPLKKAVRAAGIPRDAGIIGWHDLRHTYGSHLAMRGVPLRTVQELLGHASIEQTMRYAHLSPEVTRDAVKVLDLPADSNVGAHEGHKPPFTASETTKPPGLRAVE